MRHTRVKENKVKRAIAEGTTVYGAFILIPSPTIVEIAGYAGLDYVVIDNEHATINDETLENMVRAGENVDLTVFIRVLENRPSLILKALDLGADGVLVPHICSKQDAVAAVEAARYYPEGHRGQVTSRRGAGYGAIDRKEYLTTVNKEVMVMLLIEDVEGVRTIGEIVTVPGIDVIDVGVVDLSQSMGLLGQPTHPDVLEARDKVVAAARAASIAVDGYELVTVGGDTTILRNAFALALERKKAAA
jgi:2-keto-3-deoxy-L-rhamnonate aldolase RhmA